MKNGSEGIELQKQLKMIRDLSDPEEARLFEIVTGCRSIAAALRIALTEPDHLV
jgi:hypothetical protein